MDDAAVHAICEAFDLGDPRGAPTEVSGGLVNRMWRLTTTNGVFAVKQMNRDFGPDDYIAWLDRAFTLEQAAFAAGVPMPRPVPVAATGRCLAEIPGADGLPISVRVHAWVDGEQLTNAVAHPGDVAARAGAVLARIHNLGMKPDVTAAGALLAFGGEHWRSLVDRAEAAGADWAGELRQLLPALAGLEAYVAEAHNDRTELLLSHRDSDPKNFLRTPAGELLLVDWDAAGPVNPKHDLANEALVWAGVHLGDPAPSLAHAFVDAYRRSTGTDEPFRSTDLAELVSVRLGWFHFNVLRALGDAARDAADRIAGENVIRRNVTELPRFASSLDSWLAVLRGA